jgi:nitroreductase
MQPRRSVFALDYIDATVAVYAQAMKASGGEWDDERIWAFDVLSNYFRVVESTHPVVAKARSDFEAATPGTPQNATPFIPYKRALEVPSAVKLEQLMALARRRRSVRWYLDKPVPRELVDHAVAVAAQSPSACNRQAFVFRIIDDKERARKIATIPMGTKGFVHQLPAVAVLVGRLRAYPYERDRHAIYIDGALAAMSFMFALETLELATCAINWPDQEPHESLMRDALKLDADERVIMLVAFGWPDPDGLVPYSSKRDLPDLRQYG